MPSARSTSVIVAAIFVIGFLVMLASRGSGAAEPGTITYTVSGSPAHVTYGPAGSDLAGSVPMRAASHLGNAAYYAIDAQLQGAGVVSCQIAVNGRVVSQGHASAAYGIARCEISRDSDGQWVSDTG